MRRRWGSRLFIDRCHLARETLDHPAITTDIIVGFPGETDADFEATCRVARDCGFSKIHIFPFSARKGTPAAEMGKVVSPQVKDERCQRLAAVESELRSTYFRSLLGRPLTVLVEGREEAAEHSCVGTSCRYAPVRLTGGEVSPGHLVPVQASAVTSDELLCTEYPVPSTQY
jgi:threonylcarbamoyladenosine tRNA methylthiotransferase MtaB